MAEAPQWAAERPQWMVSSVAPDICMVGGSPVCFDSFSTLDRWDEANATSRIILYGQRPYLYGDRLLGVQGNAGQGLVSGVSGGAGYVLLGDQCVGTNERSPVVHGTDAEVNANGGNQGGVHGQVLTLTEQVVSTAGTVNDARGEGYQASRDQIARELREQRASPSPDRNRMAHLQGEARQTRAGLGRVSQAGRALGPAGNVLSFGDAMNSQVEQDLADGRSTQEALARGAGAGAIQTAAGAAGGWAGCKIGALGGGAAGVWFGGLGAGPGAFAGCLVGAFGGGWLGGKAGEAASDRLLNQDNSSAMDAFEENFDWSGGGG